MNTSSNIPGENPTLADAVEELWDGLNYLERVYLVSGFFNLLDESDEGTKREVDRVLEKVSFDTVHSNIAEQILNKVDYLMHLPDYTEADVKPLLYFLAGRSLLHIKLKKNIRFK